MEGACCSRPRHTFTRVTYTCTRVACLKSTSVPVRPIPAAMSDMGAMHMQAARLPVPLQGLGNWAAVVGRMCQAAAGQSSQEANACLSDYFNHTNNKLESLVSGI